MTHCNIVIRKWQRETKVRKQALSVLFFSIFRTDFYVGLQTQGNRYHVNVYSCYCSYGYYQVYNTYCSIISIYYYCPLVAVVIIIAMNIIVYNYYYWYDFCDCYYCIRAGIAQWLERRTRYRKVPCSSPGWSGGRINFSSPGTTFCADS